MEDPNAAPEAPSTRLVLDLRGTRFTIEQDMLMNLPESVLLCLFPNGLVLSRQQQQQQQGGPSSSSSSAAAGEGATDGAEEEEEEVYMVEFDPACLSYVLDFFRNAQRKFYGLPGQPSKRALLAQSHAAQQLYGDGNDYDGFGGMPGPTPLMTKQAIIVLREELEYFSIPHKGLQAHGITGKRRAGSKTGSLTGESEATTDVPANTVTNADLIHLKQQCGEALLERKQIFTALQRNVNKENNMAEQHLIDMLCMSGFDREDTWGFRAVEPRRCCITSIALVLLKTGITSKGGDEENLGSTDLATPTQANPDTNGTLGGTQSLLEEFDVDQQQLSTAQKLLLFWRKPARKCWWDGVDVVLPLAEGEQAASGDTGVDLEEVAANTAGGMTPAELQLLKEGKGRRTRVWARRVWTLELSLI